MADASSVVFVNFHGLKVSETSEMRRKLREAGVAYKVAKKTLIRRALSDAGIETDDSTFAGELAIAYGDDQVAPAREVSKFQKEHEGKVGILGGIFEGKMIDSMQVSELANIPSREVLYARFLGALNGTIGGFVGTLGAVPKSFVVALDQVAQKK